ncbi:MAG: GTP-binding protein [Candidatus Lokiarchaeota archaeon]|nr:GTP-binding protein [Candidatus Lokiarchaeota archaeon]
MAEEYDYLFKSIVVGDGGVGKTALTLRFSKGFFTEDYKMTIGVDFHVKTISIDTNEGSIKCKLQLWDTGGQERFSSIRPMYYRGSLGVVLVFDLTNSDSFEHLPQWIEEVRANVKAEIPLLLVGNKSDLLEQRAVTMEEINRFTRDFNLYYMETSAKTGDGVGDCFYILACLMIGQGVPEQLIANETVFSPGQITIEAQEMATPSYPSTNTQIDYVAPPVPEPDNNEFVNLPSTIKFDSDFEFEAPPVPEPELIEKPKPITSFKLESDFEYEAPPVPEPSQRKHIETPQTTDSTLMPKIEIPEPNDIEFKMPDEILSEKSEQPPPKTRTSLFFDTKSEESAKYVPKAIPFSSNLPTPVPAPEEFQLLQTKKSTQSPPSQEIESESLVDYMPDVILSKKERKRLAKEQKKLEKEKLKVEKEKKIEEEKQKQNKLLEDMKKTKKDKKEKPQTEPFLTYPTTSQTTTPTNPLFQALKQKQEGEIEEHQKNFIPFFATPKPLIASESKKQQSSSTLRIIPNISDIEKESPSFLVRPTSQPVPKEDLKSKDLLICEQCGATLSSDYAFCNKCGNKL